MRNSTQPVVIHPEFNLYQKNNRIFCSSLQVAQEFGKRHDIVLRDIRALNCSQDFRLLNFVESSYQNEQNKKQPMYLMTKNGFIFLVMGYRAKKAAAIKEAYIKRFDEYEAFIKDYILAKDEFAPFTQAIEDAYDNPQPYHFSNENNMIYRIVLGTDAKTFRKLHGIEHGKSIRPYLTEAQYKAIRELQKMIENAFLKELMIKYAHKKKINPFKGGIYHE